MVFWILVAVVLSLLGLSEKISFLYILYSPTRCRTSQSSRTCFWVQNRFATCSEGMVPVFVSVVVLHWQHSFSGFEDSAGLVPDEFVHITSSFLWIPILLVLLVGVGLWICHCSHFLALIFYFSLNQSYTRLVIQFFSVDFCPSCPFSDFQLFFCCFCFFSPLWCCCVVCCELFHSMTVVTGQPALCEH